MKCALEACGGAGCSGRVLREAVTATFTATFKP